MELLSLPGVHFDGLPQIFRQKRPELEGLGVEFKGLQGEIKADRAKRRVELWIAGYGNVDLGGDVILNGAAAQTIEEDFPRGLMKFFWNHSDPLGPAHLIEEHSQGLFMVGKVTDHPDLDRRLAQIEDKTAGHGSLGYTVREAETLSAEELRRQYGIDAGGHAAVRVIKRMRVWEGSAVIWPMNELATVVTVKGAAAMASKLSFQIQHKGLYELSDVIYCLARIRSLTSSEWAALSEDEVAAALQLIEEMTATEKSISAGLSGRQTKNSPASPAPRPEGTEPDGFKALLAAIESRGRAFETLTQ